MDPAAAPFLEVDAVSHRFGRDGHPVRVLDGVSCAIRAGEFVSIVGPSGCGKSTLLRIMAGLLRGEEGSVRLEGETVDGPPRQLTYIFQQYNRALYPWASVLENMEFGLRYGWFRDTSAAERRRRSMEMLKRMNLADFADFRPWQLSGGMQQRLALGRALLCQPQMVLLDEPFSSVDAQTRASLQDLTLEIWRDYRLTALLVTHDIDEAVYMSSRVLVLGPRPATVVESLNIDLEFPRHQVRTRSDPRFLALRNRIYTRLFGG